MKKEFFDNLPSISKAKKEQKIYGRLFIPFTINGFYVMGADKISDDYKLFIVEKWNTPFILKINYKEVLLSELTNKYEDLTFDDKWSQDTLKNIFDKVKNLYKVVGV